MPAQRNNATLTIQQMMTFADILAEYLVRATHNAVTRFFRLNLSDHHLCLEWQYSRYLQGLASFVIILKQYGFQQRVIKMRKMMAMMTLKIMEMMMIVMPIMVDEGDDANANANTDDDDTDDDLSINSDSDDDDDSNGDDIDSDRKKW